MRTTKAPKSSDLDVRVWLLRNDLFLWSNKYRLKYAEALAKADGLNCSSRLMSRMAKTTGSIRWRNDPIAGEGQARMLNADEWYRLGEWG